MEKEVLRILVFFRTMSVRESIYNLSVKFMTEILLLIM